MLRRITKRIKIILRGIGRFFWDFCSADDKSGIDNTNNGTKSKNPDNSLNNVKAPRKKGKEIFKSDHRIVLNEGRKINKNRLEKMEFLNKEKAKASLAKASLAKASLAKTRLAKKDAIILQGRKRSKEILKRINEG